MNDDGRASGAEGGAPSFAEEFSARLVGALAATLGEDGARAFVSSVADEMRREGGAVPNATLTDALVAEMSRSGGRFTVDSASNDEIVLVGNGCPFGKSVEGQPAHCALTETYFGRVASERTGYASVEVEEAMARGDARCLVRVHLAGKMPGRVFRG